MLIPCCEYKAKRQKNVPEFQLKFDIKKREILLRRPKWKIEEKI